MEPLIKDLDKEISDIREQVSRCDLLSVSYLKKKHQLLNKLSALKIKKIMLSDVKSKETN